MIIAVPVSEGKLFPHFGHCQTFALVAVDRTAGKITGRQDIPAPPHEPGLLPAWLAERGANLIIAGGMGGRARDLFEQHGIAVIVGAPMETPEKLAEDYLADRLQSGINSCDH
jgi:predicted Fe-Mo cluster-binding NifX family protein